MWSQRKYDPETDEDVVVSLWLRSYCESEYGKSFGANIPQSEDRNWFWAMQRETTLALLQRWGAEIIHDAEDPSVIFAFACIGPARVVHFAVVKQRFFAHGASMLRQLLGDLLTTPESVTVTHEIRDLHHCRLITPQTWHADSRAIVPALRFKAL